MCGYEHLVESEYVLGRSKICNVIFQIFSDDILFLSKFMKILDKLAIYL